MQDAEQQIDCATIDRGEGRREDLLPYLYLPVYAQITSGRRHKKTVVLAGLHAEPLGGWHQEKLGTIYTLLYL